MQSDLGRYDSPHRATKTQHLQFSTLEQHKRKGLVKVKRNEILLLLDVEASTPNFLIGLFLARLCRRLRLLSFPLPPLEVVLELEPGIEVLL